MTPPPQRSDSTPDPGKAGAPARPVLLGATDLPVTGAWQPGDPVAHRRFADVSAGRPFTLEGGGQLAGVTMAYETWGELNDTATNAVLVCHALTGDAHAAGSQGPGQPTPGWWDELIGPGRAIDTTVFHVVCINLLGGCQGSTGPASPEPATGIPWGSRFGVVTVRDMVRAQRAVADQLGIAQWAAVVGGSMGGMVALEWAVMFPERVRALASIASCAASSATQIANNANQRRAIAFDPAWQGGDYYDAPPGGGPHRGLALARQMAQVTYRTPGEFDERFGRATIDPLDDGLGLWQRFDIEGYLDHHGAKLVRRFDANSYLVLTRAMDLHDVGRGRGGIGAALQRVQARCLTMSVASDALYPPHQQEELRDGLRAAGVACTHTVVESPHGHDGFLLEPEQVGAGLRSLLEEVASDQPR